MLFSPLIVGSPRYCEEHAMTTWRRSLRCGYSLLTLLSTLSIITGVNLTSAALALPGSILPGSFGTGDEARGVAERHSIRELVLVKDQPVSPFLSDFDKICETVRDHFYDKNTNGVDWKQISGTYRAMLSGVKSRADFEDLVNEMLGKLHSSHTGFVTDSDIEFYMLPAVMHGDMRGHEVEHIGVTGYRDGGEFVVSAVLNGGPADIAGIRVGDHMLTVDDQPFTTAGSFRNKVGKPVTMRLRRPGASEVLSFKTVPIKQNVLKSFLDSTERSATIVTVNGRRLGYVHLWTMANIAFQEALERVIEGKLHDTDGLILDLRDGYGGSPWGYADVLYRPDILWQQNSQKEKPYSQHTGYGKPVVAIINGGTRSAKEFFAYELKASHRATLVGTRTAGAFLGAGAFEIGKDGLLELAVVGLHLDGNLLEGSGVNPDVEVPAENAYREGDRQLARAEQLLVQQADHRTVTDSRPAASILK